MKKYYLISAEVLEEMKEKLVKSGEIGKPLLNIVKLVESKSEVVEEVEINTFDFDDRQKIIRGAFTKIKTKFFKFTEK